MALTQGGDELFAFAGGDQVGEQRQRFGVDQRAGAADHDERIAARRSGRGRHAGQTEHRKDVV